MAAAVISLLATVPAGGCSGECRPTWRSVFATDLDRSLLAVGGLASDDLYAVGGGLGVPGLGALVLHGDGRSWRELGTGRAETLWWVWAAPGGTDVWMVGEGGLILRWDGAAFREVPSGTAATLYGVWGSSSRDVWIVGGLPGEGLADDNDVLLRWDGDRLRREQTLPRRGATLFKVWGASAQDVWITGELGTVWRWTPAGWQGFHDALGTTDSLLTVHGCGADEVYAVGGTSIHRFDGTGWRTVHQAPSGANGVSCGKDTVLVVGNGGLRLRLDKRTGRWSDDRFAAPLQTGFHGAWVAPNGSLWAAGGNFLSPPSAGSRSGVLAAFTCGAPAAPGP